MSILNAQETYKPSSWTQKEDYYKAQLDMINIQPDVTPQALKEIISKIGALFGEARMDLAYTERKLDNLERYRKIYEKDLYLSIKHANIPGVKTIDEINSAVSIGIQSLAAQDIMSDRPLSPIDTAKAIASITAVITNNPLPPPTTPYITIHQAIRTADERKQFMRSVMDILEQKQSSIISCEGAMKLEISFGT